MELVGGLILPADGVAQVGQRVSIQISGVGAAPFGGDLDDVEAGIGAELQLRFTGGALSYGFGVNTFEHCIGPTRKADIWGVFFEPRYVVDLGNETVALYLSGRAAVSIFQVYGVGVEIGERGPSATGTIWNGGGGFLINLGSRVNLDLGATVGRLSLGEAEFSGEVIDLGSGNNVIVRIGLAIGLGG